MGLEFAGTIQSVHDDDDEWRVGDRVFGLVPGGAYAEKVVVDRRMLMRIPDCMSFEEAAAIPEVWLTALQALVLINETKEGEDCLIHAGASGVGTAAIQLAKHLIKCKRIIVTCGSADKTDFCLALGATGAICYKSQDFSAVVLTETQGKGVESLIDFVAASYWQQNLASLSLDGRMAILALLGGSEIPPGDHLTPILRKRLRITGSTLRSRSLAYQIQLKQLFESQCLPGFTNGVFRPVIDRVFDWSEIAKVHETLESNANIGKLVVCVTEEE